jgi:hypothetical protein
MLRSIIGVSDRMVRPVGNLMRDPKAKRLASLPKLLRADAAIAMAFALRKDGSLNLPTRSIVKRTFELYDAGSAPIIFSFGSGRNNKKNMTEAEAMARGLRELEVDKKHIIKIENPEDSDLALKESDLDLLGQRLEEFSIRSSYLVAHPLHLWRARLLCEKVCEKRSLDVSFHPIEAKRKYEWKESNQLRCWAETFFIPWNISAFVIQKIKGQI